MIRTTLTKFWDRVTHNRQFARCMYCDKVEEMPSKVDITLEYTLESLANKMKENLPDAWIFTGSLDVTGSPDLTGHIYYSIDLWCSEEHYHEWHRERQEEHDQK